MKEMPALFLQEKIQYYEQSRKSLPRWGLLVGILPSHSLLHGLVVLSELDLVDLSRKFHSNTITTISFISWTVLCEKLHLTALVRITDCKTFGDCPNHFMCESCNPQRMVMLQLCALRRSIWKRRWGLSLALFSKKLLLCCLWQIVSGCDHFKVNPNLVFIRRLGHISQNCESSPWREGSISFGNLVMASDLVRTLYFM